MSTCLSGLDLLPTFDDHKKIVAQHIHDYATQSGEVEILEAGCGSGWPYSIPDIKFKLTGVDLDQNALDNRKRQGDLDECILGDLRTAEFHDESFDIIYSRFVLEHIQQAEIVLDNFNRWLKPNGLLIIMFPDRESVYSFFTRNTPFLVHILFKKYILGLKNAGRPGYGPYPTFSDEITGRMIS
jgi:SAM-dependent methyltransferase